MVRQKVGAFFHDEHAAGIELQALFVVAGVVVVGRAAGHEQQGVVGGGALGAAHDDSGGIGEVVELIFIELVVLLVGHLALRALPKRHHAVEGLQLGVGLVLGGVILAGVGGLFLLTSLFPVHLDGIAHIVAVLLDDAHQGVLVQEAVVVFLRGALLHHQDDLSAHLGLVGLSDGVALGALALPLPGGVAAKGPADDRDLAGHHEGGVEAHAELADDVDIVGFVLFLEVEAAAAGDGAQVLFQLLLRHADAVIGDGDGTAVFIQRQVNFVVLLAAGHGMIGEAFEIELVNGVAGVADELPQKDLLVGVDAVDHQVQQLFAFGFELFHCHVCSLPLYQISYQIILALFISEC